MDMQIVKAWEANKQAVKSVFEKKNPKSYKDVISAIVTHNSGVKQ